jgi:hypothetical protein
VVNDRAQTPRKARAAYGSQWLAEMVGTARSRVNFFMNKFRKLAYSGTAQSPFTSHWQASGTTEIADQPIELTF